MREVYSVGQVATYVRELLETDVHLADPWVRGDTAQGGNKPARLETGLTVQVPLFINTGDVVKVDTRSGEYLERASGR